MWGRQVGESVSTTGNWQYKMCSIDQQSTEHIALGLEEIARTCFRLALCLSFQKAVKHGRQNLCVSSSSLGQALGLGLSER